MSAATNKFVLMGNDSPKNKGCEAITKGTANILQRAFPGCTIIDCHFLTKQSPVATPVSERSFVRPIPFPARWSPRWVLMQLGLRCYDPLAQKVLFGSVRNILQASSVVLSVGGDNYSLDYGLPRRFIAMGRYVRKNNRPFIIWGASIGPFTGNPKFECSISWHLKNDVDLILVREKASQDYLESLGITSNVQRIGDPAFVMEPQACSNKIGFNLPSRFIALSTGTMLATYVTNGDTKRWADLCGAIIKGLIDQTKIPIVLIPHVSIDYVFFSSLIKQFANDQVYLLGTNLSAAELKWVISKSDLLIGSRMHATIAAFSTGVPVLSLSYSIKSIGLNYEIFGHDDYLLQAKAITPETVNEKATWMLQNQQNIKAATLNGAKKQMDLAWSAGEILKTHLGAL